MALSTGIVWEVRTTGALDNGGGFNPASSGVDYSQQNSAELSLTDGDCDGSTTLTSANLDLSSYKNSNQICCRVYQQASL